MALSKLRDLVARQWTMLANAGSLVVTTLSGAVLGIGFWAVATHSIGQAEVGSASALVSTMLLVGTIAMLGYGSLLISELPRRTDTGALIATVTVTVGVLGMVVGGAWALGLRMSSTLSASVSSPLWFLVFVIGCSLTTVTLVLDVATIGLLRGPLQMWRNLFHSTVKIALLVPLIALGGAAADHAPLAAWVVATALSVPFMMLYARRLGLQFWGPLRPRLLTELGRETWDHSMLTLAMSAPRMCLPMVVAVAVSAKANGAFFIASAIAAILAMIPSHLSTVLFAIGRGDVAALRDKLAFTLGLSFAIGLPAAAFTALLAKPALNLFGHAYASTGVVPLLLLLSTFPAIVITLHYAAVQRVRDHLTQAWQLLLVGGIAEIAVVAWFGHHDGLNTAIAALAVVNLVEGLVTLPTVVAAVRRPRPEVARG